VPRLEVEKCVSWSVVQGLIGCPGRKKVPLLIEFLVGTILRHTKNSIISGTFFSGHPVD